MIPGILRLVLTLAVPAMMSACTDVGLTSTEDAESPLPPGPGPLAAVAGLVVRDDGTCIDSASVRVVQGQGLDRSAAQRTPCDGAVGAGGFVLNDLTPGLPTTIRAMAPGYLSRDHTNASAATAGRLLIAEVERCRFEPVALTA